MRFVNLRQLMMVGLNCGRPIDVDLHDDVPARGLRFGIVTDC